MAYSSWYSTLQSFRVVNQGLLESIMAYVYYSISMLIYYIDRIFY